MKSCTNPASFLSTVSIILASLTGRADAATVVIDDFSTVSDGIGSITVDSLSVSFSSAPFDLGNFPAIPTSNALQLGTYIGYTPSVSMTFSSPVLTIDFELDYFDTDNPSTADFMTASVGSWSSFNPSNQAVVGPTILSLAPWSPFTAGADDNQVVTLSFASPVSSLTLTADQPFVGHAIDSMNFTFVPEPSSGVLVGLVCLCAIQLRRRIHRIEQAVAPNA
jgi:hypothetical protein